MQSSEPQNDEDLNITAMIKGAQNERIKKMNELGAQDQYNISGKTYKRQKITAMQHKELDILRAEWTALQTTDVKLAAEKFSKIYETAAKYFLGMTSETFFKCVWADIKDIIDACNWREEYGSLFRQQRPNSTV